MNKNDDLCIYSNTRGMRRRKGNWQCGRVWWTYNLSDDDNDDNDDNDRQTIHWPRISPSSRARDVAGEEGEEGGGGEEDDGDDNNDDNTNNDNDNNDDNSDWC